jgi:hypothetical protein
MNGSLYTGEFFLVTIYSFEDDTSNNYPVLAENGDVAIEFAKAQARRDGYDEPLSTESLTHLDGPAFLAGDPAELLDPIDEATEQ